MKRKFIIIVILAIVGILSMLSFVACSEKTSDEKIGDDGNDGLHRKHNYSITVVEPTCTEQGYTIHKCTCDDEYRDNYVDALGHELGDYVVDHDVTCTKNGIKTAKCNRCGDKISEIIKAEGHKTKQISPFTSLTHSKKCDICGFHVDETQHEFNSDNECIICGYKITPSTELTYTLSSDRIYYAVSGWYLAVDDIYIPSYYDGKPVKLSGNTSFHGCAFKNITLANGIDEIPTQNFMYLSELENFIIPSSVMTVGKLIFQGCEKLTDIWVESTEKPDGWDEAWLGVSGIYMNNATVHWGNTWQYVYGKPTVIEENENDEHEHNFSESIISPTCTEQGYTAYTCSCGLAYRGNYTDAVGHSFSNEWSKNKIAHYHVAICEHTNEISDKHSHNYINGVCDVCAYNESYTDGLIYSINPDGQSYSVSGIGDAVDVEIAIPATYNGMPVTGISKQAFYNCKDIISIVIPKSIVEIGDGAFFGCNKLIEICNNSNLNIVRGQGSNGNIAQYAENIYSSSSGSSKLNTSIDGYIIFNGGGKKYLMGYVGIQTSLKLPYLNGENYEIYKYAFYNSSDITSIEIPRSITSIGSSAFCDCSSLTVVKYMGDIESWCGITFEDSTANPLYYAHNLYIDDELITELVIPNSIHEIKSYAFTGYSSLASVVIPDSVVSIGKYAFYGCSSLSSINIPNGITNILSYTFYSCSSLTSVELPSSITDFGSYAFYGCNSLTRVYYMGDIEDWCGISFYDSYANPLYYAHNLYIDNQLVTEVDIPESISEIRQYAFYNCSSIVRVTIPERVKYIGKYAFYNCGDLVYVTIPESITDIGSYAFDNCSNMQYNQYNNALYLGNESNMYLILVKANSTSITSVTINATTKIIVEKAFYNCSNLTSISIPNSVISIGNQAFYNCYGLTSITVQNGNTKYKSAGNCLIEIASKTLLLGCKNSVIPNDGSVLHIGNSAFYKCSGLKSMSIPNGVTSIGERAFYECSALASVSIPNSVTSIGGYAFTGCSSLTNIEIPNSVTSIETLTFWNCKGLKSVTLPNGLKSIGGGAFKYCSSLTNIVIPNSVTSIGGTAFEYCSSLTSIVIPNNVTSIGDSAFKECSKLTSIVVQAGNTRYHSNGNCLIETLGKRLLAGCNKSVIPNDGSVVYIEDYAFYRCSGLTSIAIPSSVISIGEHAFCQCSGLTSITIPSSVTSIGAWAFYECNFSNVYYAGDILSWFGIKRCLGYADFLVHGAKLYINNALITNLNIPDSVTSICVGAFYGCNSITSVTIPSSVTSIGEDAFCCCSNLTSVKIPSSVKIIGDSAFSECGLTSLQIPYGVTSIGKSAFNRCHFTSITIPNSVKTIGGGAFYSCGLKSVTIQSSVIGIGDGVFGDNYHLEIINFAGTIEQWRSAISGGSIGSNAGFLTTNRRPIIRCSNGTI